MSCPSPAVGPSLKRMRHAPPLSSSTSSFDWPARLQPTKRPRCGSCPTISTDGKSGTDVSSRASSRGSAPGSSVAVSRYPMSSSNARRTSFAVCLARSNELDRTSSAPLARRATPLAASFILRRPLAVSGRSSSGTPLSAASSRSIAIPCLTTITSIGSILSPGSAPGHHELLRIEGLRSGQRLAPAVRAVCAQEPALRRVVERRSEDAVANGGAKGRIPDRREQLDAPVEISRHHVALPR